MLENFFEEFEEFQEIVFANQYVDGGAKAT